MVRDPRLQASRVRSTGIRANRRTVRIGARTTDHRKSQQSVCAKGRTWSGDTWFFRSCLRQSTDSRHNSDATTHGYGRRQMVQRVDGEQARPWHLAWSQLSHGCQINSRRLIYPAPPSQRISTSREGGRPPPCLTEVGRRAKLRPVAMLGEAAGPIWVITGVPGSGKSTIALAICGRYPMAVHIPVDDLREFESR